MNQPAAPPPDAEHPSGVLLGVDVGAARVGLAASDAIGLLAHPVATLRRDLEGCSDQDEIAAEAVERGAVGIVVGHPRSLSGEVGLAAKAAHDYAVSLQRRVEVPVRLWDERLTTVDAHRALHASGIPGRQQRGVVDQAAAVLILQAALDARRAGLPPGAPLRGRKPRTRRSGRTDEGHG